MQLVRGVCYTQPHSSLGRVSLAVAFLLLDASQHLLLALLCTSSFQWQLIAIPAVWLPFLHRPAGVWVFISPSGCDNRRKALCC